MLAAPNSSRQQHPALPRVLCALALRFGFHLRRGRTAWLRRFINSKVYFDFGRGNYGLAVLHTWAEPPLLDGGNCLFVEAPTKAAQYSNVMRSSVRIDLRMEGDGSLDTGLSCLRCVLRCAFRY
jgi:hypothetical protein